MYIALDKDQKKISIHDAVQGDVFFCPVCLEKIFVKSGTERARHFSHFPNCECHDSWNGQYDMSDWHYEWQNQFSSENQEVVVQCDDIRHRVDAVPQDKPLFADNGVVVQPIIIKCPCSLTIIHNLQVPKAICKTLLVSTMIR